jgi:hypothetical protein
VSKVEGQVAGHVLRHWADWARIHIGTGKQCPLLDIRTPLESVFPRVSEGFFSGHFVELLSRRWPAMLPSNARAGVSPAMPTLAKAVARRGIDFQ